MSLRRTVSGLASLHLFFRVDCVVYCEGGESLSDVEVSTGKGDERTLDVYFWHSVSGYLNAKRRYHFKSVGSKLTLKSIANDVHNHGMKTIVVCFDRDYDWHCGRQLPYPHVAYTFGYSWESDVCCPFGLERLFFRLIPRTRDAENEMNAALAHFEEISKELVRWCEIEITLSSRNLDLLFVRDKPLASIDVSGRFPALNVTRIRANLTRIGFTRRPRRVVTIQSDEVMRHVWGKLASRFLYHLFVKLVGQRVTGLKMSYDVFMRLMVSEMVETMRGGLAVEKANYYQTLRTTFA